MELMNKSLDSIIGADVPKDTDADIDYRLARDMAFTPPQSVGTDFRYVSEYISAGLKEITEEIDSFPRGIGELQNRGNFTLEAIKFQFERARDVMEFKRKRNTSSLAWCLQYGAKEALENEIRYLEAVRAPKKEKEDARIIINQNLEKLSRDLNACGLRVESTPRV